MFLQNPQNPIKLPPRPPSWHQNLPSWLQDAPKLALRLPTWLPRPPKMAPRSSNLASKVAFPEPPTPVCGGHKSVVKPKVLNRKLHPSHVERWFLKKEAFEPVLLPSKIDVLRGRGAKKLNWPEINCKALSKFFFGGSFEKNASGFQTA